MIREEDLLDAIAECQGEKNPNANTCMKLAAYHIILDHLRNETPQYSQSGPPSEVTYNSGSEFSDIIIGRDLNDILPVIDELLDTVQVLIPKLYYATLDKLKK